MQRPPQNLQLESLIMDTPLGGFLLAATSRGLCLAIFIRDKEPHPWFQDLSLIPHVTLKGDEKKHYTAQLPAQFLTSGSLQGAKAYLWQAVEELAGYFSGTRTEFTCKLKVWGTPFQEKVWNFLNSIPYGKTITYSDVASGINHPKATRAVANAIGSNPISIIIPCHRVIGKNGTLTGYGGGLERKKALLTLETEKLLVLPALSL